MELVLSFPRPTALLSSRPLRLGTSHSQGRKSVSNVSHGVVSEHNLLAIAAKCSGAGPSFARPDCWFSLRGDSFSGNGVVSSSSLGYSYRCRATTRLPCSNGFEGATAGEESFMGPEESQGWEKKAEKLGEAVSTAFPFWVGLACVLALRWPNATGWVSQGVQVWGITITMLGMGMTLTPQDFQGAIAMPKELLAGVVLQYTVMPSAGYFVSRLFQLPPHYAAGLILVACCPGGTASNIVTYLARCAWRGAPFDLDLMLNLWASLFVRIRGNVALSVLMTAASTFLAVVMTPVLTAKLVGQYISVDVFSLFVSTVQVVLLPVLGGAILNHYFHKAVKKISIVAPTIAVLIVAIVCAGSVGRSSAAILSSGGQVVVAVLALHATGFASGYLLSRVLGIDESSSRTICIEVGMQNSVLGVVLAGQHFSNPLTAVPCAVSSVCHSLIGSSLAGLWRQYPTEVNNRIGEGY